MADSHSSRVPMSPAELVGNRIDENRLFEARFLFQKFTAEIDPAVGEKLRKQLEIRIARAEQAFAQGELLERAGKLEQAGKVYADLAGMVLDYPSLAEAQQRVELAIKLGPLEPVEPRGRDISVSEPSAVVERQEPSAAPLSGPSFFQRRKTALLLVFFLVAALGAVSFRIFFRAQSEPPVVLGPVVQAEPEASPGAEEAKNHLSVTLLAPAVPVAAESEAMEADRDNAEPVTAEGESVEQQAALSAPPVAVEEQSDAKEPPPAVQEESDSGPITEANPSMTVSEPVAPKEGEGRAADSSVEESPPKAAPVPETSRPLEADGSVQEQKDSSPEPQVVPEVSETTENKSGTETSLASQEQEERKGGEGAFQDKEKPGPTVDPDQMKALEPAASADPGKIYTVQAGDTLETIADSVYGSRFKWSLLVAANQEKLGSPPYILRVGMQLQVPPPEVSTPGNRAALLNDDGTYTVRSGDSLGSIALKLYGASWKWDRLYKLNRDRLSGPTALRVGQRLLIDKKNIPDDGNNAPAGE